MGRAVSKRCSPTCPRRRDGSQLYARMAFWGLSQPYSQINPERLQILASFPKQFRCWCCKNHHRYYTRDKSSSAVKLGKILA